MAKRKVFHVTFDWHEERWTTLDTTGVRTKILRSSRTKAAALRFAIKQAKSRRHNGQVVVHNMWGKIQHEWTYGCDPVNAKG